MTSERYKTTTWDPNSSIFADNCVHYAEFVKMYGGQPSKVRDTLQRESLIEMDPFEVLINQKNQVECVFDTKPVEPTLPTSKIAVITKIYKT